MRMTKSSKKKYSIAGIRVSQSENPKYLKKEKEARQKAVKEIERKLWAKESMDNEGKYGYGTKARSKLTEDEIKHLNRLREIQRSYDKVGAKYSVPEYDYWSQAGKYSIEEKKKKNNKKKRKKKRGNKGKQ